MDDLLIVGGGLNGLTCALAAATSGLSVCLVDAQPSAAQMNRRFDGRAYALSLASVRLMKNIDIWPHCAQDAQPMRDIKASDGRAGEGACPWHLHFQEQDLPEGPMGHMVEDRHLRAALLTQVIAHPQISYIEQARVSKQQDLNGKIRAHIDTKGDTLTRDARVLIGADGRQSATAKRAGLKRFHKDYSQTALVCAVSHDRDHGGVAHQFFMPNGPLAILPLTGQRSTIVWSETHARASALKAMQDDDFLTELRPAFGSFLGSLSLISPRSSYPLSLSMTYALTAGRVALVGDAARGVHPIAGQGLNAGLQDISVLIDTLQQAKQRGDDLGSSTTLGQYQRRRRYNGARTSMATNAFNALFSNDNSILRMGRALGLKLINAQPSLKSAMMRDAAGLSQDTPALMRP